MNDIRYRTVLSEYCIPRKNDIMSMIETILTNSNVLYYINDNKTEIIVHDNKKYTTIKEMIYETITIPKVVLEILISIENQGEYIYIRQTAI